MTETTDFYASYLARHQSELERGKVAAEELKAIVHYLCSQDPALAALTVIYDGCGDEGTIESIQLTNADDEAIDSALLDQPFPDALQDLVTIPDWLRNRSIKAVIDNAAWDVAYGHHPGFEINEGGFGELRVEVEPDDDSTTLSIALEHNERFTETTSTLIRL
jgi:hypothetical protein